MKHSLIKIIAMVLSAALFVLGAVNTVMAISTDKAKEYIDTDKPCSLCLTYRNEDKTDTLYEGLEIEIYQAASVTSEFYYQMTGSFSDIPVILNQLQSQSEWDDVKDTVGMYVAAGKAAPDQTLKTKTDGTVKFENLKPGIYYVRWTGNRTNLSVQGFAPFLIPVPFLEEDGTWTYDLDTLPKPGRDTPVYGPLSVTKIWNDSSSDKRPVSVNVSIYCDGALYQDTVLNAGNNWTYTWVPEGEHEWSVLESPVPDGYFVLITRQEDRFIITNTQKETPDDPPPATGDTSRLGLWITVMAVSGTAFLCLGFIKRKQDAA